MVIGITNGVGPFTAILGTIVVGFALGFFVLFKSGTGKIENECGGEEELEISGQSTVGMSILSGYTLMLGDFDVEAFDGTSNSYAAIALFVIFMYLVNIVLLNLLIAIM